MWEFKKAAKEAISRLVDDGVITRRDATRLRLTLLFYGNDLEDFAREEMAVQGIDWDEVPWDEIIAFLKELFEILAEFIKIFL